MESDLPSKEELERLQRKAAEALRQKRPVRRRKIEADVIQLDETKDQKDDPRESPD